MALYTYKFGSLPEVEIFLQGGIIGGADLANKMLFVHGKTLIFTGADTSTVTFVAVGGSAQSPMSYTEVIAQIKSQTSNAIAARALSGKLVLLDAGTPTTAVGLAAGSTALADLGFKGATAVTGKFFNPPDGSAPRPISISASNDSYVMLTEET